MNDGDWREVKDYPTELLGAPLLRRIISHTDIGITHTTALSIQFACRSAALRGSAVQLTDLFMVLLIWGDNMLEETSPIDLLQSQLGENYLQAIKDRYYQQNPGMKHWDESPSDAEFSTKTLDREWSSKALECLRMAGLLCKTTTEENEQMAPYHLFAAVLKSSKEAEEIGDTGLTIKQFTENFLLATQKSSEADNYDTLEKFFRSSKEELAKIVRGEMGSGGSWHRDSATLGGNSEIYASVISEIFLKAATDVPTRWDRLRNWTQKNCTCRFDRNSKAIKERTFPEPPEGKQVARDFCFGLFGRWGRGKSVVADLVCKKLKSDHDYDTVVFNAWRYPKIPDIWVHLFETFRESVSDNENALVRLLRKLQISFLYSLEARPPIGLFLGSILLLLGSNSQTLIPLLIEVPDSAESESALLAKLQATSDWIMLIVGALMFALFLQRLVKGPIMDIKKRLKLPSYKNHLGLQAAVGADLQRLIKTWVLPPSLINTCLILASAIFLGLATFEEISQQEFLTNLGGAIFLVLSFVLIALLLAPIFIHTTRPKRLLLVVDDIDRCPESDIQFIVEAIRVFLDQEEINDYLQVMMLIDDDILKNSMSREGSTDPTESKRIEEQLMKYFVCTFKMPPSKDTEIESMIEAILPDESEISVESPQTPTQEGEAKSKGSVDSNLQPSSPAQISPNPNSEGSPSTLTSSKMLEQWERSLLLKGMKNLDNEEATPRSLRRHLFRYYLGRSLDNHLGGAASTNRTFTKAFITRFLEKDQSNVPEKYEETFKIIE